MSDAKQELRRRILIASANPLFALGLQKLVVQRSGNQPVEIHLARNMEEVTAAFEGWQPDLVIVDYNDAGKPGNIQREAFLSQFISGSQPMQVMLVSLGASGEVVVYDRRTLTPAEAEHWLDLPWSPAGASTGSTEPARSEEPERASVHKNSKGPSAADPGPAAAESGPPAAL